MQFEVIDPMNGQVLDVIQLTTGQQHRLSGAEDLILSGKFQ